MGDEERRIADLGAAELEALVRRGDLKDRQVLEVLRNPYCATETAVLVAENRSWLGSHKVRELLAGFRGLPFARAMDLLATLPWTSLLLLAQSPKPPPVVRRQAEKRLLLRLQKMSLGEKVALARRSHRPLFRPLVAGGEVEVLRALFDNPRVVENDVLVIINSGDAPPELATELARHRRWGRCYAVRRALVVCPATPVPIALGLLVELRASDIAGVVERPGVDERVRCAAAALVERRAGQSVVRSPGDDTAGAAPDTTSDLR